MSKHDRDEEIRMRLPSKLKAPLTVLLTAAPEAQAGPFAGGASVVGAAVSAAGVTAVSTDTRLADLIENVSDGYLEVDAEWRITHLNSQAEALLRPGSEVHRHWPGSHFWRAFPELVGSAFEATCQHVMVNRSAAEFDWAASASLPPCQVRVLAAGNGLTIFLQKSSARAETGGDSTAQSAAQSATHSAAHSGDQSAAHSGDQLSDTTPYLRALLEAISHPAWIARADGAAVYFNQRWHDYTGTTPAQLATGGWEQCHKPSCLPHIKRNWQDAVRDCLPFEMEYPIRGADGQFRWFLTRASPICLDVGPATFWLGTSTDVDQTRSAKDALRDERTLLELFNATGAALPSARDLRSLLQQVTDAATRISGARHGAFIASDNAHGAAALDVHSGVPSAQLSRLARVIAAGSGDGGARYMPAALDSTPGQPLSATPAGSAQTACPPLRIDDLANQATDPDKDRPPSDGDDNHSGVEPAIRSLLVLPVLSRSGTLLGQLVFGHPEAGIFTERSERLLAGIAAQAAVAIDNNRLYEAARHAAEERTALLDSVRSARAEAERTSQLKDEFLATLSHELRTPLSAILGWAQVLRRGTRDEADLHRGLQTIERNARAQAQMIEDLLDMSRITSGKVLLDMVALTPASVIDAALEAAAPAAAAKNIRLEKINTADASMISGDAGRLQQVFWNLLSNAIKFTPRDRVVTVTVRPVAEAGLVEFCISDTGVGIHTEFLAHVFERFRQADSSTTRRHGGLGLGLSIVKHLVEQHGGEVQAYSAGEDLGASFTVQLPMLAVPADTTRPWFSATVASAPMPQVNHDLALPDLTGLTVLIVDDDADARDLLKRILTDCAAQVITAANAQQALAQFALAPPGLLISDIGMPGTDGYQLLAQVRALSKAQGGNVSAIALTAFAHPDDQRRTLAAGFQAHITKPVEPSRLAAAVSSIVIAKP